MKLSVFLLLAVTLTSFIHAVIITENDEGDLQFYEWAEKSFLAMSKGTDAESEPHLVMARSTDETGASVLNFIATRDIQNGSTLFEVSSKHLIYEENVDCPALKEELNQVKAHLKSLKMPSNEVNIAALALLVMREKFLLGSDSGFAPYLNMIPLDLSTTIPAFFAKEDFRFAKGTFVEDAAKNRNSAAHLLFIQLNQLFIETPDRYPMLGELFNQVHHQLVPFDRFRWSFFFAESRSVYLKKGDYYIILPGLDFVQRSALPSGIVDALVLIGHNLDNTNEPKSVQVLSPWPIAAGDFVTLPSQLTNANNFALHGIVVNGARDDCGEFRISWEKFPQERAALAESVNMKKDTFCGTQNRAGVMTTAARILAANDEEFKAMSNFVYDRSGSIPDTEKETPFGVLSDATESRMLKILGVRIKKQIDAFPLRPYEQLPVMNRDQFREVVHQALVEGEATDDERFKLYLRQINSDVKLKPHQRKILLLRELHRLLLEELHTAVENARESYVQKKNQKKQIERLRRLRDQNRGEDRPAVSPLFGASAPNFLADEGLGGN